MRADFTPSKLYNRLPYGTTVPSRCPDLPVLAFDCRVNPEWIERNLKNTPFLPAGAGDRIVITSSDYAKNEVVAFRDVTVMAPVEYKGMLGGHPILEFENSNRLVMGGREKWGYPKLVADITFDPTGNGGFRSVVSLGSTPVIELEWEKAEIASTATPLQLSPNLLLRVLPDPSAPGISFAEVLKRDTSPDVKLIEEQAGRGTVRFAKWPEPELDYCGIAGLEIREIVSATFTRYDWQASSKNGWGHVIDRLL